jgi:hypothetical protein
VQQTSPPLVANRLALTMVLVDGNIAIEHHELRASLQDADSLVRAGLLNEHHHAIAAGHIDLARVAVLHDQAIAAAPLLKT